MNLVDRNNARQEVYNTLSEDIARIEDSTIEQINSSDAQHVGLDGRILYVVRRVDQFFRDAPSDFNDANDLQTRANRVFTRMEESVSILPNLIDQMRNGANNMSAADRMLTQVLMNRLNEIQEIQVSRLSIASERARQAVSELEVAEEERAEEPVPVAVAEEAPRAPEESAVEDERESVDDLSPLEGEEESDAEDLEDLSPPSMPPENRSNEAGRNG